MSYDLPFLSASQRRLKKLRQQTEVDYATPARAPRAYEPDIATPQQLAPQVTISELSGSLLLLLAAEPAPTTAATLKHLVRLPTLPFMQRDR